TSVSEVRNRMNLLWGVRPMHSDHAPSADDMVRAAEKSLLALGAVKNGDVVGVVAGTQLASGSTNFLRLHVVGGMLGPGAKKLRRR
ncbi:MAG: pyruvate kinase alpha/beta domain-containing protein, partial [Terriglobales bacterium]